MFPALLILTTLLIILILTVLIESVVLQLLGWGPFKESARDALIMNLASILVWPIMVFLVQQVALAGLVIAIILSIAIEGLVLSRIRREYKIYNFIVAGLANLASYLILILPAFWYSTGS